VIFDENSARIYPKALLDVALLQMESLHTRWEIILLKSMILELIMCFFSPAGSSWNSMMFYLAISRRALTWSFDHSFATLTFLKAVPSSFLTTEDATCSGCV